MYRSAVITLGTFLLVIVNALPQTRRPATSTTAIATAQIPNSTPVPGQETPHAQEHIQEVVDNTICSDPLSGTTTTYGSNNVDIDTSTLLTTKSRLAKRGNCLAGPEPYYSEPPYLDDIIRPIRNRVPTGNHYGAYRPPDDNALAGTMNAVRDTENRDGPDENLEAEQSVAETMQIILPEDDGGGVQTQPREDDYMEEFDERDDEFGGGGLNPSAFDFERGILTVPGGVAGGVNGGFGVLANRRRALANYNDLIQQILMDHRADAYSDVGDFPEVGSRPREPSLLDQSHSVIDEGTLDVLRRAEEEELASGYENIGHPGDMDEQPNFTDIPLRSITSDEESEFPDAGDETLRLIGRYGRGDLKRPGY